WASSPTVWAPSSPRTPRTRKPSTLCRSLSACCSSVWSGKTTRASRRLTAGIVCRQASSHSASSFEPAKPSPSITLRWVRTKADYASTRASTSLS
ncbi:hypothetical protein K438DRAFT_1925058, partial [Mycena galopus ATCC 62051]